MTSKKIFAAILFVATCAITTFIFTLVEGKTDVCTQANYIYIDKDDNADSVFNKANLGWRGNVFNAIIKYKKVRTGRYKIEPGSKILSIYRKLRNGQQEPLNLTVPSVRTMNQLASRLSSSLMIDSLTLIQAFQDEAFCEKYGYTTATIPALFIPNTYEVYWDITLEKLVERMKKENANFWTKDREEKAKLCGLSHEEIATLASIVDEETANNEEKPMIAGMYLNRLHIEMPLQADPTVKFTIGDFSLKRIYNTHLKTESPYNTYTNIGLPPGPIRIPSVAGLDAVINAVKHPYLYMCAKEDFSGTHNFATTYTEHLKNARKYVKALNERNIR